MKTNILIAAGLLTLITPSLSAATLTWDPLGAGAGSVGGSGTWDTSSNLWWNGASDTTWGSATNNADIAQIAISNNTAITLSGTIYAGGVNFIGSGSVNQTLTNGILVLTGSNSVISVANSQAAARLYSQVQGNGFTKSGPGTLFFNTAGVWTGDTIINSGVLDSQVNNGLSTNTALKINSGTLRLTAANQSFASIEGASGTTITSRNAANILTVTGARTTTFSGNITQVSIANPLSVTIAGVGTKLTLTGSGNDYYGTTTISAGTLILGSHLSGSTNIIVSGGSLQSSISSVNLGTGNVNMSSGDMAPGGIGTAGTLVVAEGKQFITTGGTLQFDLGNTFDHVTGSGAGSSFNLTDTTLALNLIDGFSYTNTYQIFSGFANLGSITNLNITGYDNGTYTALLSDSGKLSFVPEPSTMALLLGGLGVLAIYHRRQQRRSS